jgi:hypothetical protein
MPSPDEKPTVIDLDAHIAAGKAANEVKPVVIEDKPVVTEEKPVEVVEEKPIVDDKSLVVEEKPEEIVSEETPIEKPDDVDGEPEFTAPEEITVSIGGEEQTLAEVLTKYSDVRNKLQAIEADPFLQKIIEYRLAGGEPDAFLNSQTKDWTKPTDFQILKEAFFASDKVAGLDEEAAEELFSRELSEKGYSASIEGKFEDENSKEARVGKQLMQRDAAKIRASHIEAQKKFSYEKPAEKPVVQFDPIKARESVVANEQVKTFMADKLIGISGTEYAHEVADPEVVIGMMADPKSFYNLFKGPNDTVDFAKLQKVFAFATNIDGYEKDLLDLGYSLGEERYLKEKKNISDVRQVNQDKTVDNGTFSAKAFLDAAKAQKVSFR